MDTKLTKEQSVYCLGAIGDVWRNAKTDRVCPVCKQPLFVEVDEITGSGEVRCETPGCFGKLTLRGI